MNKNISSKDNRFEIIKELKEYIIEATNIETSPKEMEVLDVICFRLWQLGLTLETKRKFEKENQELKELVDSLNKEQILGVERIFVLEIENEKLKNAIEIAKNIIDWKHKIYYWYEHNFITKAEYELLKEVLEDEKN